VAFRYDPERHGGRSLQREAEPSENLSGASVLKRRTSCDREGLRLLLEEGLPAAEEGAMLGHLDSCADCRRALEQMAGEETWWEELRHVAEAATTVPLSAVAEAESFRTGSAVSGTPVPCAGLYLGFLDPSDEPGCLGRLGPFAITAVLGQGGMGIVLGAFDALLDRPVAIKVLSPHLASSAAARSRFAREARAAAAVVHPHVVPIHGVDTWKGLPYLVMSHVAGRSLQEHLADGPLPVQEVLRIAMQAASGLAAAHARGLVHRDIKPANILLEEGSGRALLTDFGLARAADDAGLTQSGTIPGTPQYMAPEQARGEPADHRADLFSLGSTLYAMCTGQPPFGSDAALAVLRRVCTGRPRPIRSLAPAVPPWLADFIARLHAPDPAHRFQSATLVADLLERCLAHVQRPSAVPLPREVLAPGAAHPRRARWGAVGAVILCCLGAGLALWPSPQREGEAPQGDVSARPPRRAGSLVPSRGQDGPLDDQLKDLGQQAGALDADLKQPAGDSAHPADEVLRQVRLRLDALQRELGTAP
jgi:serine/threonine-protein kinase